jgi:hypothetical protein
MKTRVTIIAAVISLVASLTPATMVMAEEEKNEVADSIETKSSVAGEDSVQVEPRLIAYYFHGTRRCVTCKKLESYTQEAIEAGFAEELKAGTLAWRPVNTDEAENEHFRDDYQLYTKSVILSERKDGEEVNWKNLNRIWELVRGDKAEFVKYIQDEVAAALGES